MVFLSASSHSWCVSLCTQHRIRLTRKHIVSENLETCAPIRQEQLHRLFENPEFFRSLPVVPGARKSLLTLRAAGCAIHIVTDRFWYGEIDEDTMNWLVRHRIPFDSVAFARKAEKQDVARRLKIDWFIEDQLSNARLLSSICPVLLVGSSLQSRWDSRTCDQGE